ncbi:hypothetical protein D3C72_529280 [compost metagenome]
MTPGFRKAMLPLNHAHERQIAPIIADGAVARQDIGDGRMFPLVILDTTGRPDIDAAIAAHDHGPAGEVRVQWGRLPDRDDTVMLVLTLVRPAEAVVMVEFDLNRNHGVLVEQVMANKGLYIQPGRPGDRLKHDPERPKIIVEVADTGFRSMWDRIFLTHTAAKLRRKGLSRMDAKRGAKEVVARIRSIAALRPFSA